MDASRKQSFQDKGVTKQELGHEGRRGSGRGRAEVVGALSFRRKRR